MCDVPRMLLAVYMRSFDDPAELASGRGPQHRIVLDPARSGRRINWAVHPTDGHLAMLDIEDDDRFGTFISLRFTGSGVADLRARVPMNRLAWGEGVLELIRSHVGFEIIEVSFGHSAASAPMLCQRLGWRYSLAAHDHAI